MKLETTFGSARKAGACREEYDRMAAHLGGVDKYGEDTPIPLTLVLDICGLDAALWALRCTTTPEIAERVNRLLACDYAERALPVYEADYPSDMRPRHAIEVARRFANGQATLAELHSARAAAAAAWAAAAAADAARAAAWAARAAAWAAADAAWAAAWDARNAARAAERDWQEAKLREYLA